MSSVGRAADFSLLTENDGGSLNDGIHSGFGAGYGTIEWSLRSTAVPEPSALALFGLGLGALVLGRRRGARLRTLAS